MATSKPGPETSEGEAAPSGAGPEAPGAGPETPGAGPETPGAGLQASGDGAGRGAPGAAPPSPAAAVAATAAAARRRPRLDPSNLAMLRQLYVNLCVQHGMCAPGPDDAPGLAAHREAEAILAAGRDPDAPDEALSWAAAYRAEQLIVRNLPTSELRAELARRAAGQAGSDDPERQALAKAAETLLGAAPFDEPEARGVLLRLVSARQWDKTERTQIRELAALYRERLNLVCVGALGVFLLALFLNIGVVMPMGWTYGVGGGYSGLVTAIAAGLFGASFSALVGSRKVTAVSIEAMKTMASVSQIAARLMVGGGGAAIVYFFFETGLIQGVAIPDLDNLAFARIGAGAGGEGGGEGHARTFGELIPNADVSLLMIWSFLAGFSESFVPRMLTQVEGAAAAGERRAG
ncbi:hypothetical protein [Albimonas pacifica]|uniref:hypothetical protein n=1 Tax=Albimonas pacifica TaxID=1114924 RepID=UPI000B83911B|nr:hypothetical protein [Albimonas pacifica]